jgi:hypothetical protein
VLDDLLGVFVLHVNGLGDKTSGLVNEVMEVKLRLVCNCVKVFMPRRWRWLAIRVVPVSYQDYIIMEMSSRNWLVW